MIRKNPPCCWLNAMEQKIEALEAKLEALVAEREIKDAMVRTECAGLYMEMADGKKRTKWLEEYTRMLDKDMQSVARRVDGKIEALDAKIGAPDDEVGRVVAYVNAQLAKQYYYHETDLPGFWAGWGPVAEAAGAKAPVRADEPVHYTVKNKFLNEEMSFPPVPVYPQYAAASP